MGRTGTSIMDIKDVKRAITDKKIVKYDNANYIVTACILRLKGDKWQYTLELKDLKANNSVRIVNMEKVEG